jgi:acyl carrier protein
VNGAWSSSSAAELIDRLEAHLQGARRPDVYTGNTKAGSAIADILRDGTEAREFVKSLVAANNLSKLARLWVAGVDIDWQLLYQTDPPLRCSLPTYPFARERYWVSEGDPAAAQNDEAPAGGVESTLAVTVPLEERVREVVSVHVMNRATPGVVDSRPTDGNSSQLAGTLEEECEMYLKRLVSSEIKLPVGKIDSTEPILNYGIDSVVMMKLKSALDQEYGDLPVMLFFEYKTIRELAAYFVENHRASTTHLLAVAACPAEGAA